MLDALPVGDGFDRHVLVLGVLHRRENAVIRRRPEIVGADLHHAAGAVREEEVALAGLLVHDHVDRTVAVAELGDGAAADLGAGRELADGELDERRAGVGGEHAGFLADLERDEGAHRGARLEPAVRAVVDLDSGAAADGLEGVRHRAQRRGELLVGEAGDDHAAVDVRDVGDRFLARIAAASARGHGLVGRGVRQRGLGELHLVERDDLELAGGRDAHQHRSGVGPAAAGDREIGGVRHGVDHHVVDEDLVGRGSEEGGDLLVDPVDSDALHVGAAGGVVRGDRKDRGGVRVGGEEDAVRPEGQRSDGLEVGVAFLKAGGVAGDGEQAGDGKRGEQTAGERFHGGNKWD